MNRISAVVLGVMLLASNVVKANPPDITSPEYQELLPYSDWIQQQYNQAALRCCDIGDARPVEVRTVNNHYQVWFIHPESLTIQPGMHAPVGWQDVPDYAILKDAKGRPIHAPDGINLAWWYNNEVRCFALPFEA